MMALLPARIREQIFKKTNGRCGYCGDWLPVFDFTIDHMIPKSKLKQLRLTRQGYYNNFMAACFKCNQRKGPTTPEEYRKHLQETTGKDIEFYFESGIPSLAIQDLNDG